MESKRYILPMAKYSRTIEEMLRDKISHRVISKTLGCSKSAVSSFVTRHPEHRRIDVTTKSFVDWDAVDRYFQDHGFMITCKKFNLKPKALFNAIMDGRLESEYFEQE